MIPQKTVQRIAKEEARYYSKDEAIRRAYEQGIERGVKMSESHSYDKDSEEFEKGLQQAMQRFKQLSVGCMSIHELDMAYEWLYREGYAMGEQSTIDLTDLARRVRREEVNGKIKDYLTTVPILYVQWRLMEGEKPSWLDYARKMLR